MQTSSITGLKRIHFKESCYLFGIKCLPFKNPRFEVLNIDSQFGGVLAENRCFFLPHTTLVLALYPHVQVALLQPHLSHHFRTVCGPHEGPCGHQKSSTLTGIKDVYNVNQRLRVTFPLPPPKKKVVRAILIMLFSFVFPRQMTRKMYNQGSGWQKWRNMRQLKLRTKNNEKND